MCLWFDSEGSYSTPYHYQRPSVWRYTGYQLSRPNVGSANLGRPIIIRNAFFVGKSRVMPAGSSFPLRPGGTTLATELREQHPRICRATVLARAISSCDGTAWVRCAEPVRTQCHDSDASLLFSNLILFDLLVASGRYSQIIWTSFAYRTSTVQQGSSSSHLACMHARYSQPVISSDREFKTECRMRLQS